MTYATINPYTGDTVATFPDATDEEVKTALDKADAAFLSWRETSFAERGRILQNAADILRRDSDAFARLLTLEMGKLVAEAKAEVELSAKIFEYYVRHAEDLLKPEKLPVLDPAEGEAMLVHELAEAQASRSASSWRSSHGISLIIRLPAFSRRNSRPATR